MGYILRVSLASFFTGTTTTSFTGLFFIYKDYKFAHESITHQVLVLNSNNRIAYPGIEYTHCFQLRSISIQQAKSMFFLKPRKGKTVRKSVHLLVRMSDSASRKFLSRLEKHDSYTEPIKRKDELVFHVGFRQFVVRPIYSSDNINADKC